MAKDLRAHVVWDSLSAVTGKSEESKLCANGLLVHKVCIVGCIYVYIYIHILHYIALHYITLHYITLPYITLHYITLHIYIYMLM